MKQILPYCSTWLQILSSSPSLLCCAGLHLPLLQFVVGWPWTWNNPLASVSQTLRLQFMCHWAWLFGLILESGPVSLSISCPLHIDINIIRTAARGTVVRSPFCTLPPFHTLKVSSHPHATSSSVPEPRERLDQCFLSLYLACGFTYSRLSWVPDHPRRLHACCLEPSSAQCWLHPHSSDCNSSEPSFQSHSSPLGRSVTTLSLMKTSGAYGFVSPRKWVLFDSTCVSRYFNKNLN